MSEEKQTQTQNFQEINYNVSMMAETGINTERTHELRVILLEIQKRIGMALEILSDRTKSYLSPPEANVSKDVSGRVIEGVFDGQHMIGQDGKEYLIPPNYASKSKLVEGDILKLIIADSGAFIYKQIGPITRRRVVGKLTQNENGEYFVRNEESEWKVLPASVTYFKGELGSETAILVPQSTPSKWAAVENIIKTI